MFTSPDQVRGWTTVFVDGDHVRAAQFVIESYIGRIEEEIDNPYDLALLARATAWQAVYMAQNREVVWEQIALIQAGQNESMVTFDSSSLSPFMHRMAVQACSRLSWLRSRHIKTGPTFDRTPRVRWEFD